MKYFRDLSFLISFKFLFLIILLTVFIFSFLDIYLFKLSRSCPGIFFQFFQTIIDPFSDLIDPFNLIILSGIILFFNSNIQKIISNEAKMNIIKSKTGYSIEKIRNLFDFISLICKHYFSSLIIAGILCNLVKYIMGVSRPKYYFLEGYERLNFFNIEHKVNSFPSGHTQAAFTLAVLLIIYCNKYVFYILIIAVLMGLSRIFMSMHFPSDLIAGAYLGSVVPYLIYKYYFKKKLEAIRSQFDFSFKDLLKLMYWRIYI